MDLSAAPFGLTDAVQEVVEEPEGLGARQETADGAEARAARVGSLIDAPLAEVLQQAPALLLDSDTQVAAIRQILMRLVVLDWCGDTPPSKTRARTIHRLSITPFRFDHPPNSEEDANRLLRLLVSHGDVGRSDEAVDMLVDLLRTLGSGGGAGLRVASTLIEVLVFELFSIEAHSRCGLLPVPASSPPLPCELVPGVLHPPSPFPLPIP